MDIPLPIIGVLLAATLAAFFGGVFPYPHDPIVLPGPLVARLVVARGRRP